MIKSEPMDDGDHSRTAGAEETSGTAPSVQKHDNRPVAKEKNESQKFKREHELSLLYEHFVTLDHYYVGKNGNPQSHRACVCKHCKSAGEAGGGIGTIPKAIEKSLKKIAGTTEQQRWDLTV